MFRLVSVKDGVNVDPRIYFTCRFCLNLLVESTVDCAVGVELHGCGRGSASAAVGGRRGVAPAADGLRPESVPLRDVARLHQRGMAMRRRRRLSRLQRRGRL